MKRKPQLAHSNVMLAVLAGLLFILVLSTVAAAQGTMGRIETWLFYGVYDAGEQWRRAALLITQLGHLWMMLLLVGLLLVVRWNPRVAVAILRNSSIAYIIGFLLKLAVDRSRPVGLLGDVIARETIVRGNGFPSLHVALATVMSLTLMLYAPKKLWWLPLPWIVLVAWSRLYLGVHAPMDILGGLCLGALVVFGVRYVETSQTRAN